MDSKMKDQQEACFDNSWYSGFSTPQDPRDGNTLVDDKKKMNADGEFLDTFFRDSEKNASPCEVEVLADFCRGMSLKDVELCLGTAGYRRAVWLDDRENNPDLGESGDARQYGNPLTASGLYQALKKLRFNEEKLPDAARRLIYITNLDPACIYALAATASWHQAPALRNAIYKHLAFQTSIAVNFPSDGFLTFQLDLHMPFFLLRKSLPPSDESVRKVNTKPRRRWIDLSFLKIDTPDSPDKEPKEVWGMYEAQISCVVTGPDDFQWVGYGFVDTEIDGDLDEPPLNEPSLDELSKDSLNFDPISDGELDANIPISRPRDYWLKVFEIRIKQVGKEWDYFIYKLELSVNKYVRGQNLKTTHSQSMVDGLTL
jgi:hypothetical protein